MGFLALTMPLKIIDRKSYILAGCVLLFMIAALRNVDSGPDTASYVSIYQEMANVKVWDLNGEAIPKKDPFFYLFAQSLSSIGLGYRAWLSILGGIFCFAVYRVIKDESEEPFLSFIALISLGYFFFQSYWFEASARIINDIAVL